MEFLMEENKEIYDIAKNEKIDGYCVINAITNLVKADNINGNIEKTLNKARYVINNVFKNLDASEMLEFMNNLNRKLGYNLFSNKRDREDKFNLDYDFAEQVLAYWKKFYNKRNGNCLCGNAPFLSYALLKNMGYEIYGINKQISIEKLEEYHKQFGNFLFEVRGHESTVINGKIVDFFNPYEKRVGVRKEDEIEAMHYSLETRAKKRLGVGFIIYKK